ncbi:MAG TPA: sulfite exporter TauE/SafE family protein [Gemmatimonadales bacterium]|nr:sulfite exporter TauE/SafE family protein [Gemmatimonadales bacterium]
MVRAAAEPVPTLAAAWFAAFLLAVIQSPEEALLIFLGFGGAFVAGLVGVGGAVVVVPLLLYVPPLFHLPRLDIHTVSGISMVQVAAAGVAGVLGHMHHGYVPGRLVATLGGGMATGAFLGAGVSGWVPAGALTALFATLALGAAVIMFLPREAPDTDDWQPHPWLAAGTGLILGVVVGMVGAGGGFLLVPVLLYVLRVPLRPAVSASLAIVLLTGLGGTFGKAFTGQVDWFKALALVTGALPGARLGASLGSRLSIVTLARALGTLIAVVAFKMWWDILQS